jgi:hypothetical protein
MPRGRKSQGAGEHLSIRVPADLREKLGRSAEKKGHSLNNEIRRRLSQSFANDEQTAAAYGDVRTKAFFRLLSFSVGLLGVHAAPRRKFWLDDRYQFRQVDTAIQALLAAFEPAKGQSPRSQPAPEFTGLLNATHALDAVRDSEVEYWRGDIVDTLDAPLGPHVAAAVSEALKSYLGRTPQDLHAAFRRKFGGKQ